MIDDNDDHLLIRPVSVLTTAASDGSSAPKRLLAGDETLLEISLTRWL